MGRSQHLASSIRIIMSVGRRMLTTFYKKQPSKKYIPRGWLSSPPLLALKKYGFLGISVLCVSSLQGASFFGPQWIHRTESGLNVQASAVAIAPLLQEWCQVCQKQCVIDHEIKQKLSLNLDHTSCEELLEQLSSAVTVEQVASGYAFKKQSKGSWAAYQCLHRSAQEISGLLKQVLTPAGKYEHFLTDNVSNIVWIPKEFYQNHQAMIQKLDTPKKHYMVHISWLRVNEQSRQDFEGGQILAPITRWLQGSPVTVSIQEVMGWLQGLNQTGVAHTVAEASALLVEGETTETKVSETLQTVRVDKKGGKGIVEQPQVLIVKITPTQVLSDKLELEVLLEESSLGQAESSLSAANQSFKSKIPLRVGNSIMLGGVSRQERVVHKNCQSALGRVPIIGALFCKRLVAYESRQYGLVLTLSPAA